MRKGRSGFAPAVEVRETLPMTPFRADCLRGPLLTVAFVLLASAASAQDLARATVTTTFHSGGSRVMTVDKRDADLLAAFQKANRHTPRSRACRSFAGHPVGALGRGSRQ
jgi:hypothetical protein